MTISLEGGREMVVSIIFFERNAEQTTMRVLRGNGITVNLVCGGWLLVHVWESRKIIGVDGGSWGECESDLESTRDKRKKEQFF